EITHHQPFQFAKRGSLKSSVCGSDCGILAHDEETFHLAILHVEPVARLGVVAGDARKPSEAKFVVFRCCLAVPGFEEADDVLLEIAPPSGFAAMTLDVLIETMGIAFPKWHGKIAGQNVVESGNVG